MISKKMEALVNNSSIIRAMFEEGKKLSEKYGEENVYDFSIGNPNVEPPKEVKEAIFDILNNESGLEVHGYMNNSGYESVRKDVADFVNKNSKLKIIDVSEGLAIIPTEYKTEILCWEFKGKVEDNEFLVYVNAKTGEEEDILVIVNTPNGTLTH